MKDFLTIMVIGNVGFGKDEMCSYKHTHNGAVHIVGADTGNAVENENKVREQQKKGENEKRQAEPGHLE